MGIICLFLLACNRNGNQTVVKEESKPAIFTIDQVINRVWGWDNETELNLLWVTISQLRKKLAELGTAVEINAVRGVGYSLEEGHTADDA